ncbi:MAG TPA: hypothetical protein DD611_03525 [Alphaproteobacteria bacterium]|nr:hypothetical protein [Alphaproteobacteria bacterium]
MKNGNIIEICPGAFLDMAVASIQPAKTGNPLARHDNFLRGTDIYMLDSFASKTKMKNAAFVRRIKDAITEARDILSGGFMDVIPTNWKIARDWNRPRIDVYVNCPDATLSDNARAALAELARAAAAGVKITAHITGNQTGAIARALLAMEQFSADRTFRNTTTKQR